jgi:hypothetical protein
VANLRWVVRAVELAWIWEQHLVLVPSTGTRRRTKERKPKGVSGIAVGQLTTDATDLNLDKSLEVEHWEQQLLQR